MKKISYALLMVFISLALITSFAACNKLKLSNLKANDHFKKGNKLYTEEKFKKAIAEYELALKYNPKLDVANFYLGTSYAMVFKPGDETEKNKEYGQKAQQYLNKALEVNPGNREVILALGDINDKMRNFEEAEKYYQMVLESSPNDPKVYYVLADFYSGYGKFDQAIEMFQRRIALSPSDPEGYYYLANFLQNKKQWDKAIENHDLRIKYIAESNLDEKVKNQSLAEAYYTLGVVCWNKSYQTPPDVMGPAERNAVIQKGFEALNKATDLIPTYPEPWAYKNLLYRELAKAEPLRVDEYTKKADEMSAKFTELRKRKLATEEFIKGLEKEK